MHAAQVAIIKLTQETYKSTLISYSVATCIYFPSIFTYINIAVLCLAYGSQLWQLTWQLDYERVQSSQHNNYESRDYTVGRMRTFNEVRTWNNDIKTVIC